MFGSMERSKRDLERSGLDLIRNRVTCDTWYCLMAMQLMIRQQSLSSFYHGSPQQKEECECRQRHRKSRYRRCNLAGGIEDLDLKIRLRQRL